jgi:phage terminase large subunit-like protein
MKPSNVMLLASLSETERRKLIRSYSPAQIEAIRWDWRTWARPEQLPPGTDRAANPRKDWVHWIPLAGRGWGKTRVGAETVRAWAESPTERIHLVGPTAAATRSVMVEGPSGLLSCYPAYRRPDYEPSRRRILFPSGAVAETFSADEPERLRGPACSKYWADEPCAWRFLEDAWDNLMFGLRLGDDPRGICTTTPRPVPWLLALTKDQKAVVTRHSSRENRLNLTDQFFGSILGKYEGTRLGRQEIDAEILEDVPGALWTRKMIEDLRVKKLSEVKWELITRIVVAIDPAVSHSETSDETGIIVAGLTRSMHVVILDDLSGRYSPAEWASVAVSAFRARGADRIIGEVNNGGDLVGANIRALDPAVPFRAVHASRGKYLRAEPVAALYEQGRVHHVGAMPELEDQMCTFTQHGGQHSPDRLDALVWAITELVIDPSEARVSVPVARPYSISPI